MRCLLILALVAVLTSSPALAAPDCEDNRPGLHISFGFSIGRFTDEEQATFDKMHLRQNGIIARDVKRTDKGCIAAWVPDGQGGFSTEYYNPRTFQLVLD